MRKTRPTLFRGRHFQDHIIVLCVRWYLRYCLTLRDLEEMMAERGLEVDHSTIGRWVLRKPPNCTNGFAAIPEIPTVRGEWTKPTSASLGNGPIYIGPWISTGETIDFLLSPKRDAVAAKHFLQMAMWRVGGIRPRVINVDGHAAYPQAIRELKASGELGRRCKCRPTPYLNNVLEQDHRFVKKRMAASLWFRSIEGRCEP
jgi:transposase-like protein